MKTTLFISTILCSIIFSLSSCLRPSRGKAEIEDISSYQNFSAILISKDYTNYDIKFGYEVTAYEELGDGQRNNISIFVPSRTWERMIEPNDSTMVIIEYIEKIEYGATSQIAVFDSQFNIATGFTLQKK